jgi:predicted ATPase
VAGTFEEGAAFVSLASLADDRLVVGAIARAVGLRDSSGATVESLAADLSSRSLLLVVDNFEHVMGAADVIAELLTLAPRLKVVATSREALRIQAEHEFPVPPLTDADSVAMFAERAASVRPDLRLDESDGGIVDRICRRLEGVPLAIELAAARVKLLPPDALLERLDRRLDFLVGGPRDLPERQRALRNTIEWSYDLLDADDQRVFASLGVFVGSFPLAAAEAVLGPEVDALDLLGSLVDKSLLRVEPTAGEPRFRMLSMIAEFAQARLAGSDDADRIGSAHAAFFRDVAVAVGEGVLAGGDQRRWLAVLGDDHEGEAGNVRAAITWYLEHRRLEDLARMAWALWVPAWINGRIDEGRRIARAALDSDGEMSERSRTRLLVVLGLFHLWSGDHEASGAALAEGAALARDLGDEEALAAAMLAGSMIVGPAEGEAHAEQLADETLARYERLGDAWGEAATLNVLGWLYVAQERFDGHADVFERTLERALTAGDEQFAAMAEVNLAEYALHEGDVERATALLSSCAARHRSLRLLYSVAYLLDGAARLALRVGDAERATRLIGAATQLRASAGVSVWGSQLERRDRFIDELRALLGDEAFAAATEVGSALCYADAVAQVAPLDGGGTDG